MNRGDKLIPNAMPPVMRECIQCKKTLNVVKVKGISFSFTGIKVGGSIPPIPRSRRLCHQQWCHQQWFKLHKGFLQVWWKGGLQDWWWIKGKVKWQDWQSWHQTISIGWLGHYFHWHIYRVWAVTPSVMRCPFSKFGVNVRCRQSCRKLFIKHDSMKCIWQVSCLWNKFGR
jgi:hypothetical protein